MAYRSPEMVDLYQRKKLSEKVDIWALGCLLYKLSFFTTPFEDANGVVSSMAILSARYRIPASSNYSENLHNLIRQLLEVDPNERPSIDQVIGIARSHPLWSTARSRDHERKTKKGLPFVEEVIGEQEITKSEENINEIANAGSQGKGLFLLSTLIL